MPLIRFFARGVQHPTEVKINGTRTNQLGDSSSDGSLSTYAFRLNGNPQALLRTGSNTLTIRTAPYDPSIDPWDDIEYCSLILFLDSEITQGGQVTVRHASSVSGSVTVRLAGRSYEVQKGGSVTLAVTDTASLGVWECLWRNNAWDCRWDSYQVSVGRRYKIVDAGPRWDLTLRAE
jgi:hypothetical protein